MPTKAEQICQAYTKLTDGCDAYQNQWIIDKSLVLLINTHFPSVKKAIDFDSKALNRALIPKAGLFDTSNKFGLFKKDFSIACPYDGQRRKVWYYYRRVGDGPIPTEPSQATDIVDQHVATLRQQEERKSNPPSLSSKGIQSFTTALKRRGGRVTDTPKRSSSNADGNDGGVANEITPNRGDAQSTPSTNNNAQTTTPTNNNNAQTNSTTTNNNDNDNNDNVSSADGGSETGTQNTNQHNAQRPIYWQSERAAELFGFSFDDGEDVYEGLKQRIDLFTKVLNHPDGWKEVVDRSDEHLSSHGLYKIRNKCIFLRAAYKKALDVMGTDNGIRWVDHCCKPAVEAVNGLGFTTTINAITLSTWNTQFRVLGKFPHPNPYVANGLERKPAIFDVFPQAAADVSLFITNNLSNFNVEMVRLELINKILPRLKEEVDKDEMDEDCIQYKLITQYITKPPSYMTVLRWVKYLGFTRSTQQKSYYVDGHEHEAQKKHRSKFTTEYLTKLEPCSHRWVQMTVEKYLSIQATLDEKEKILPSGYKYKDTITGIDMIEFHVDDHECMQKYADETYGAFGGNVSVRKPAAAKPIIIFGQDESVFSQYSFNKTQWVTPDGQRPLLPKNNGVATMVSAFQSRERGWGLDITDEQLKMINEKRANEHYFDKEAAMEVHNTTKKKPLTSSPYLVKFEFGGANGYWNGSQMVIQVEDCLDAAAIVFGEQYEIAMLFDHSSGHAKKRMGGLDVKKMLKGWGGEPIRNSLIERKEGYLGPYYDENNAQMVKVGQEQCFVYREGEFPFYLSPEDRVAKMWDVLVPLPSDKVGEKDMVKDEIVAELMKTEYGKTEGENVLKKKLGRELRERAKGMNIPTTKMVTHRLVPGYMGKPKGMFQSLFETGWIDVTKLKQYKKRAEDEDGNLIPEFSLVHLMESRIDFYNEMSQLEFVCKSLGARALITTKYHAEYAGEGIEYSWGFAKMLYRQYPFESKKGKVNFDKLLDQCISRDCLTVGQVRRFVKRARGYMVTYKQLEMREKDDNTTSTEITHYKIENMKKIIKSHRAALDFDKEFIMKSITVDGFNFDEEVDQKMPAKKRIKRER